MSSRGPERPQADSAGRMRHATTGIRSNPVTIWLRNSWQKNTIN